MTANGEREQLLAEIAANPEDDTSRLAFADWLDEHGDAADHDRAGFVRVQYQLATMGGTGVGVKEVIAAHMKLCNRERQLLSAHPEWSRCRCPNMEDRPCPTCGGTGDLFKYFLAGRGAAVEQLRTIAFARGFPDSVTCTLAECFVHDGTPTPWAVAVVRQTPVMRFVMTDFVPYHNGKGYCWYNGTRDRRSPDVPPTADLPMSLFLALSEPKRWVDYPTTDAATDALALAAGRLVRRHAYKERT